MYMKKYPCVYMRGGTSKAVFFHEKDLCLCFFSISHTP